MVSRSDFASGVVVESAAEFTVLGVLPLIFLNRWVESEKVVLVVDLVVEPVRSLDETG